MELLSTDTTFSEGIVALSATSSKKFGAER